MDAVNLGVNMSDLAKGLVSSLPPAIMDKLGLLITILEVIGALFIIYLVFLIIKSVSAVWVNHRIKEIARNVEEINRKLDSVIKGKVPKPSKN
jgi:hypothetical protein